MSNTKITDSHLNQENKNPLASCYDLVKHPEEIKTFRKFSLKFRPHVDL